MEMTPRQLQAFLFLANKRRQQELRELLHMTTLGTRGDEKVVRQQLRDWEN
jgi:hypothetical protein